MTEGGAKAKSLRRIARWTVQLQPEEAKARKNYQVIGGQFGFLFGGRGLFVKGKPLSIVVFAVYCITSGLYFGFTAPWVWHHVSPAIVAVTMYLFVVGVICFIRASLTDPGILPRSIHIVDDADYIPQEYTMNIAVPGRSHKSSSHKKSSNQRSIIYVKYCETCHIWRPPRSGHCARCDRCIDMHDHHCVWLNNCVGRRNYRFFLGFIWVVTLLGCIVCSTSWYQLIEAWKESHKSFAASASDSRVSFILAIFTVFALIFPMLLVLFHFVLACRGQTTREYLRKFDRTQFASGKGLIMNFFESICRPRGNDLFMTRGRYTAGDRRFE